MRILIYGINYTPELTGIGKYTGEMAEWMVEQGHDVSVITAMPYYPEWNVHAKYKKRLWLKETINDVKIYRCPLYVPPKINSKKRIIHEFTFLWSSSFRWFSNLFKKKYDLIISISPPFHIGIFPYLYSKLKKTTLIMHIQDLQIDAAKDMDMLTNQKALNLMFKLEKIILNNSQFVSTLTPGMKERVERKGIQTSKIIMLPNWVDLNIIKPLSKDNSLREKFGIPRDAKVILYSGNMGKKQGLEILIEAAETFKEQKNVYFLLVGTGAERDNLENFVNEKKLSNVRFYPLQPYEQLSALLATADIHLVLQKKDASDLVMPSKLTGILAAGGCSIVTALPDTSLYNVVKKHNIGFICEPESKEALAEAINEALKSDWNNIKLNARKYAEENLDKDTVLHKFIENISIGNK